MSLYHKNEEGIADLDNIYILHKLFKTRRNKKEQKNSNFQRLNKVIIIGRINTVIIIKIII